MFRLEASRDLNNAHNMNEELKKRLSLFFCDPTIPEDDYYLLYRAYYPGEEPPAYSPLYRLRRELYYHRLENRWFSAMLLPGIIIEGIIKNILHSDVQKPPRELFDEFYSKYFNTQGMEGAILRLYRNAQEHNFGLLINRVPRTGDQSQYFEPLKQHIETSLAHHLDDTVSTLKLTFPLSTDFGSVAQCDHVLGVHPEYLLLRCPINPKLYLVMFDRALQLVKEDIESSETLQQAFSQSITRDNWIRVYYPFSA